MSKEKKIDDSDLAGVSGGSGIQHLQDGGAGGGSGGGGGAGSLDKDSGGGGGGGGVEGTDDPHGNPADGSGPPLTNMG